MEFTAEQVAGLLEGKVEGDKDVKVNKLAKIEEGEFGALSFLANPKYNNYLYDTDASVVIVNKDLVLEKEIKTTCTLVRVENAYESFSKLLEVYNQIKNNKQGIETPSYIDESATLGEDCYVGAFAYVGENVVIGKNVKIFPHVYIGDNVVIGDHTTLFSGSKVYSDCVIGNHCTFHSGVVVGSDGFGFAPNSENNYQKVPQIGNVIIEDHVEVGSNATIDRATLGSTVIKKGVKIDNLVQIAHNVVVGENTVIAAQTGIAGSTKLGKNIMIGGQVGVVGHLQIADGTKIAAQSGIGADVKKENTILQGSPAYDIRKYKMSYVKFRRLPEISNELDAVKKELEQLKKRLDE